MEKEINKEQDNNSLLNKVLLQMEDNGWNLNDINGVLRYHLGKISDIFNDLHHNDEYDNDLVPKEHIVETLGFMYDFVIALEDVDKKERGAK